MTESSARLAVFASGGGSNLGAISDHLTALGRAAPARVALVLSDRVDAGALERARAHAVSAVWLPRERATEMAGVLEKHGITHIALAGYLRLVPADVVRAFRGRLLNVHPALLPAFGGAGMYGRRVHEAVLRAGARVSGATVHFVDERYDEGAIIAQWPVPVLGNDTAEALAARVLAAEHLVYPRCVAAACSGAISLGDDGHVQGGPPYEFDRFVPDPPRHPFAG